MTNVAARNHKEEAHTLRRQSELIPAGNEYVLASHEYFGADSGHLGIECLFNAAISYRLSETDKEKIAHKIAYCGITGAEYSRCRAIDYRDDIEVTDHYRGARSGAWHEMAGDVLLAAGNDEYREEYDKAAEWYQKIDDLDLSIIENEHTRLIDMYRSVAVAVGNKERYERITSMEMHYNEGALSDWLDVKRKTLPEDLESLFNQKEWDWENEGQE